MTLDRDLSILAARPFRIDRIMHDSNEIQSETRTAWIERIPSNFSLRRYYRTETIRTQREIAPFDDTPRNMGFLETLPPFLYFKSPLARVYAHTRA